VVWEWLNEHGRWRPYSPAVSHHIEAVARAGPRAGGSVVLGQADSRLAPYIIDLQSMHQFRQDTGESARAEPPAGRALRRAPPLRPRCFAPLCIAGCCAALPGRTSHRAPGSGLALLGAARRCPVPRCPRLPGPALPSGACSGVALHRAVPSSAAQPCLVLHCFVLPAPQLRCTAPCCWVPSGAVLSRSLTALHCTGLWCQPRAALPSQVLSCLTRLIWICSVFPGLLLHCTGWCRFAPCSALLPGLVLHSAA